MYAGGSCVIVRDRKAKIKRNYGSCPRRPRIAAPRPPARSHPDHGTAAARSGAAMTMPSRQPAITSLDAQLGGGFPRGQVSELIGPRSSGRASLVLQALAAATATRRV